MKKCPGCEIEKQNTEYHHNKNTKDGLAHYCIECRARIDKEYYRLHSRHRMDAAINWIKENRERFREKERERSKERYRTDINYKLRIRLRTRIRSALRGIGHKSTENLTGCTMAELKLHLENGFSADMNWENYGTYWNIDHIKPCISFDLSDEEEQRKCFHYSNLQPLTAKENRKKWHRTDYYK